jgi:hypothetical protein
VNALSRRSQRDSGFTLPELLIAVVITMTIVSVLAMTIITTMKTAPSVTNRADTAVAVQGITTWLPPDVDSAQPGLVGFNTGAVTSGCTGTDPGTNIVRLQWFETFDNVTIKYVANYRYVIDGAAGEIVRLSCNGQFALGAPQTLKMSAKLSTTLPVVTANDFDGDGKNDMVRIEIVTLAGEHVFIEAASKNPNDTLAPLPTTTTTSTSTSTTSTSTTTTSTTAPNQPPTANDVTIDVNDSSPITFALDGHDPEGGALTGTIMNVPSGPPPWDVSVSGINVTLTAYGTPGTATLTYQVADTLGALSPVKLLTVNLLAAPTSSTSTTTSTTTTTTTTTSTTTTTTVPPCVVGSMSVTPSTVQLQNNTIAKLKNDVIVTIGGLSGYCVGITLQYDTGAPNNQWVRSFPTSAPYTITLEGQPHGTELWSTGTKVLYVKNGSNVVLNQANLVVTN